jgi:hypothetical protein
MTLDAAATTIGDLVFGKGGQDASRWPAFLVRLLCELGPHAVRSFDERRSSMCMDVRYRRIVGNIGN